jgi:hypothetical protein
LFLIVQMEGLLIALHCIQNLAWSTTSYGEAGYRHHFVDRSLPAKLPDYVVVEGIDMFASLEEFKGRECVSENGRGSVVMSVGRLLAFLNSNLKCGQCGEGEG